MNTLRCSFRSHWVSRTLRMVLDLSIPLRPRNAFIELDKTLTFSLLFIWTFYLSSNTRSISFSLSFIFLKQIICCIRSRWWDVFFTLIEIIPCGFVSISNTFIYGSNVTGFTTWFGRWYLIKSIAAEIKEVFTRVFLPLMVGYFLRRKT